MNTETVKLVKNLLYCVIVGITVAIATGILFTIYTPSAPSTIQQGTVSDVAWTQLQQHGWHTLPGGRADTLYSPEADQ